MGIGAQWEYRGVDVGCESPFNRHFCVYTPPRPSEVIRVEIEALEEAIQVMLGRVFD